MTDYEVEKFIDIGDDKPIRIREISPCEMCEFQPIPSECEDSEYATCIDCPMSLDFSWEIPVDIFMELTKVLGCSCFRQKRF